MTVVEDAGGWLEWAVAGRPIRGENRSGDHHIVQFHRSGVLIAMLDGLGHGDEAAAASYLGAEVLAYDPDQSLESLMRRCHQELIGTRGAAVTLVSWNPRIGSIEWLAVGNVEAVLLNAASGERRAIMTRAGVVGIRLPTLRSQTCPVRDDDVLLMATDGLRSTFMEGLRRLVPADPEVLAQGLLRDYSRENDDALVLVARVSPSWAEAKLA